MISRYSAHGLTWVDLASPTPEETQHIAEEFGIPPLVGEELVDHTLRSKVDLYPDFLYLVLHFPTIDAKGNQAHEQEVDFLISKTFVITARYEAIAPMQEFEKHFEASTFLHHERLGRHGDYIFMQMMKLFYKRSLRELEDLSVTLKQIEHGIFTNQEDRMVRTISFTARKLLDFKQALRFHHDILKSYESTSKRLFGEEYGYYAEVISGEFNKVESLLEGHRDTLAELQRTNDSLLSTKSNRIMRTFTAMSFITFPLMLVVGVFGMNMPSDLMLIKTQADFFFIIGSIGVLALILLLTFKWRRLM